MLIAWRAVMGAGAALTIPASLSIINDVFRDPAQRAKAIGAWAATIGLGIAIGPIAGGLLLAKFWWGSIFLVNVPIVIAAFAGAMMLLPDSKNPAADRPDPAGAALSIAGLGLLLWAIIEGPTKGWSSVSVVGVGALSVAALAGFIAWEAHTDHPMLNLAFFRDRRFSIAAASESLGIFGLMGVLFLQTQFLQFDLGYSPLQAGLRILPTAAMICLAAPLSPIIARRIGIKLTVAAALAAIAGGLWQISAASTPAATYQAMLTGLLLIGVGAGLLLPTATNSVVGSVPQGDSGIGSATNTVALQVGGALGVAVIGSAMLTRYQSHITAALTGRHVPIAATHAIIGSLGGALTVAGSVGGATGAAPGARRPRRVHERHADFAGGRRARRPRRRPARARPSTVANLPTITRSQPGTTSAHRDRSDRRTSTVSPKRLIRAPDQRSVRTPSVSRLPRARLRCASSSGLGFAARSLTHLVLGRTNGHQWREQMAAGGENRWPYLGRNRWSITPAARSAPEGGRECPALLPAQASRCPPAFPATRGYRGAPPTGSARAAGARPKGALSARCWPRTGGFQLTLQHQRGFGGCNAGQGGGRRRAGFRLRSSSGMCS